MLAWLLLGLALAPRAARADYLSCQADLKNPDCSDRTGPLAVQEALLIGATCQVCTGGGSDVKCSPDEKVTAAGLAVETTAGAAVAGSFGAAGACPFGVQLFKLGVGLAAGSYRVVVSVSGFAKTELLAFTVGGGAPPLDGGGIPREAGQPAGDGGGTGPGKEAGGATGDGRTTVDGGPPGTTGGSSDGGCGCELAAARPAPVVLFLGIVFGLLAWRQRP
jgi:hypothetical protein